MYIRSRGESQQPCIYVLEVKVSSHVYIRSRGESKQSCIYVLEVMYIRSRGHVYTFQRSCIYVLEVMYIRSRGHVYIRSRGHVYIRSRGHVYTFQRYLFCLCFYGLSIRLWRCSDIVLFIACHVITITFIQQHMTVNLQKDIR